MSWEHPRVLVKVLPHGFAVEPARRGNSGVDLRAAIPEGEHRVIGPDESVLIPCGFAVAIPRFYEGQVRSRSGVGTKARIVVTHGLGTIDASYRGEIMMPLHNVGRIPYEFMRGARLAQLVIAPVCEPVLSLTLDLEPSDRGAGGFGSTGIG